jgi:NitT/TauT family transport system permease protein
MTDQQPGTKPSHWDRLYNGQILPVVTVILAIIVIWYAGAVYMNSDRLIDGYERAKTDWTFSDLVEDSWSMERPILPAPQQIVVELDNTVIDKKITSKRSLVFHAWVTLSSTLLGFAFGTLLGIVLAVGIVHVKTLDRSLMPWVIASQTIPILAIAPMIIVVLGHLGLTGLVPKAIISMYLCFFPITIGMVKGLRSPDILQLDLMKTYSASNSNVFWKLRIPASIPYLFTSLKVAVAISLVGAIVAELPTGAVQGLGARLLAGSYYGQTIQIWSALVVASILGMVLVWAVGFAEKLTLRQMGG